MSLWQLESVLDVPRNLRLKFHQNRVGNSWDIADIEFDNTELGTTQLKLVLVFSWQKMISCEITR